MDCSRLCFQPNNYAKQKKLLLTLKLRDPNLKQLGPGYIRGDGEVVGVSFAIDGYADYFPFGHEAGFNFSKKKVIGVSQRKICATNSDKIFHNATYDVGWLAKEGITVKW